MFNRKLPAAFTTPPSLLLAMLVAAAIPIVPTLQFSAQAQDTLEMPDAVAPGTQVWIDGDPSLKPTTEALSDGFEEQFPGAGVNYESQGSDSAVTGVIAGRLDVAAIGRGLTTLEERAGVETVSLPREKIATFVSVENPFRGDISHQDFAKIFRGEITNWSELGGEDAPIRFIDLAATSDTRRSLGNYELFQAAPFESGETAIIQPNNISTVIENLGNDGIGYALFQQIKDRPDIRILPMHGVMPTDPRYPFSQPRNFAYLATPPNPEAEAFLGYVSETIPETDNNIANLAGPSDWSLGRNNPALDRQDPAWGTNKVAGTTDSAETFGPQFKASTTTAAAVTAVGASLNGGPGNGAAIASDTIRYRPSIMDTIHAPWWWLLPLLPLGVIGMGALRRRRLNAVAKASDSTTIAGATANPALTPSTSPEMKGAGLAGTGLAGAGLIGLGLAGRRRQRKEKAAENPWVSNTLSNGTIANDDAAGFALGTPHHQTMEGSQRSPQAPQGDAKPTIQPQGKLHSFRPNPPDGKAKPFTGSKVPATNELNSDALAMPDMPAAEMPAADIPAASMPTTNAPSTDIPKVSPPKESNPNLITMAGAGLAAAGLAGAGLAGAHRDGTDSHDANSHDAKGLDKKHHDAKGLDKDGVSVQQQDLSLTGKTPESSEATPVASSTKANQKVVPLSNTTTTMTGAPKAGVGHSGDTSLGEAQGDQTWITLTPLSSHHGEVNWHISEEHRLHAKQNGGQRMMIRIHDADPATQPEQWLSSSYAYECRNSMDRKQVDLPVADRDYVAEIGYLTEEEDWIHIARSFHSHSPTEEYDGCRIVIMPCDPHRQMHEGPTRHPKPQAYVYWDIAPEYKRRLRKQGGQMLALRIYDADHINLDQQAPHHTDEYMLDENARDKVVTVPTAEHDYVAEIGYLTIDGQFLSLGRSVYAHIPVKVSSH